MIPRRDFLFGAACLGAVSTAEALRPRRRVRLIGSAKLDEITPRKFGPWSEVHIGYVVQPRTEGTLSAELYSQMLGRVYVNSSGDYVMLALAYGDTQSDMLQLHRPETCYPAFGFSISQFARGNIDFHAADIPIRNLVAEAPERLENISYWTRIGEYFPTTRTAQQEDKHRIALTGIVPDGILVRASSLGDDASKGLALNRAFLRDLLLALAPEDLPVLVGARLTGVIEQSRDSP